MAYKLKMFFIAAIMIPLAGIAQTTRLSLQEAVDYGIKNSPQVQTAGLNVRTAEITVDNRIATGLPQIDAKIDYQNFLKLPTSLIPGEFFGGEPGTFVPVQFGTEQNVTASISASQLLFNGAWLVGVSAAKQYAELVQQQSKLATSDVRKNIESAYYGVLVAKRFEDILQENINNLNKVLFEVSALNQQGFVESIDVDRLTMSKLTLEGQLTNAQRQSTLALNFLKFNMGMDLNTAIELTDTLGPVDEVNIAAANYLNRPEFGILQTMVTLNELNVKVNKAAYLPSLVAYGSYSQNAQRNEFNFFDGDEQWFDIGLIGVTMSIPVFSGTQRRSNVQLAEVALEKAKVDQYSATQGILLEIEKAKTDYENAVNDLTVQEKNIALAQKIYDTALIKYREGVGSSLELNSAESTLYQAQGGYISALYNLLNTKTSLNKALGNY